MKSQHLQVSRRAIITGLASSSGLVLAGCSDTQPPTYGNVLRMADNLTYRAQRLLLPRLSLAREYDRRDITSIPAIGTTDPADPHQGNYNERNGVLYRQLRAAQFAHWRLRIEGSVSRPASFSLAELQRFPARTQITKHTCEEGWSAIAAWTGVPLRLRVERQLGYKSLKFVHRIVVTDRFEDLGKISEPWNGWAWYVGI
jgi:DMSO/TMAO reductase YedYZ molybdopterin-dependent catalytic subunit